MPGFRSVDGELIVDLSTEAGAVGIRSDAGGLRADVASGKAFKIYIASTLAYEMKAAGLAIPDWETQNIVLNSDGSGYFSGSVQVGGITAGVVSASDSVVVGTANQRIYFGTGAPAIEAAVGSIYLRTDGVAGASLYVMEPLGWAPAGSGDGLGVYNVKAYGAVGDGVTDDTVAIQAAITAAGAPGGAAGTVHIPRGYYKVSATLVTEGLGCTIRGDGMFSTYLMWDGADPSTPMFRFGWKWQRLDSLYIGGDCSGVRCASGVALNQKDSQFTHIAFHNSGDYGILWDQGEGTLQCDNGYVQHCEFASPDIGIHLNSGEVDMVLVEHCEFSGCAVAGIRGTWGGWINVKNVIFGACDIDIDVPLASAGLERIYLDNVEGESHDSGYMARFGTVLEFLATNCIFADKTFLSTGNSYCFINCLFNAVGIETNGAGVSTTEINCRWAGSPGPDAGFTDLAIVSSRTCINPSGPGSGNIGTTFKEITLDTIFSPGGGKLTTKGSSASVSTTFEHYIDGSLVADEIYDTSNGYWTLRGTTGIGIKKRSAGDSDFGIFLPDGFSGSNASRFFMFGNSQGGGNTPYLRAKIGNTGHAYLGTDKNGSATNPDLILDWGGSEKLRIKTTGVDISNGELNVKDGPIIASSAGDGVHVNSGPLQLGTEGGNDVRIQAGNFDTEMHHYVPTGGKYYFKVNGAVKGTVDANGYTGALLPLVWTTPTYLNNWVTFDSNFFTGQYTKDAAGRVHLRGRMKDGIVGGAIFVLPVGYRPSKYLTFAVSSNLEFGVCGIVPNGNVMTWIGSNADFNLDGVSFDAS